MALTLLHAQPLVLSVSVEADIRRCLVEPKESTELTQLKQLTVAQTLHPLPLLLSVLVDAVN